MNASELAIGGKATSAADQRGEGTTRSPHRRAPPRAARPGCPSRGPPRPSRPAIAGSAPRSRRDPARGADPRPGAEFGLARRSRRRTTARAAGRARRGTRWPAQAHLVFSSAEHASVPRERRRVRATPQPWSVEELGQWLRVAQTNRFAAMWILAATTGGGAPSCSASGKTDAGIRTVSVDAFTVAALRRHLAMLDDERAAFGTAYARGGWLFVWQDGRRPHPGSSRRSSATGWATPTRP
jgi:hypothetical protein